MKAATLLRDAVRAKEIAVILARYGFADFLRRLDTPASWLVRILPAHSSEHTLWQRIRFAAEELGPTFIKMGQILSTRPDILPPSLTEELGNLRDQVKPEPFEVIRDVLENNLDGTIDDHFIDFDREPLAGGSMAQVHKARLKHNGEYVAVKIQRPNIARRIHSDLEIFTWIAQQAHERIEELRHYDLPGVVAALKRAMKRELDFSSEAANAILFSRQNDNKTEVFAPAVHEEFTTSRLIVTELVAGSPPLRAGLSPEEGARLARVGGRSVLHQTLVTGFFHADPHEGNILITPDHRICFIDWGQIGQLTRAMRYQLADLLDAITSHDPEKVSRIGLEMAANEPRVDEQQLEIEVTRLLNRYGGEKFNVGDIGRVVLELLYVLNQYGVQVRREITLLGKAIVSIDQVGRRLDPDFELGEIARPFVEKLAFERMNPFKGFNKSFYHLRTIIARLQEVPNDLLRLLRRVESEDISIQLKHSGLEPFGDDLNKVANRVSLAIILGSIIIGSSMIITTGIRPHLWGYPALGLIGYLVSFVLGVWVIFDILRHGKHR